VVTPLYFIFIPCAFFGILYAFNVSLAEARRLGYLFSLGGDEGQGNDPALAKIGSPVGQALPGQQPGPCTAFGSPVRCGL
jgi:hypothetical protein